MDYTYKVKSEIQLRYSRFYEEARYGRKKDRAHHLYHGQLEKHLRFSSYYSVLEVGAGVGEHFEYVRHDFKTYIISDIVLPDFSKSPAAVREFKNNGSILSLRQLDAEQLDIESDSVDRVIFTCVLHHLNNPSKALDEARRVVRNGGTISIYLPADPGLLYRVAQTIGSTRKLRKHFTKMELLILRGLEHRNHFASLAAMIRGTFYSDDIRIFGVPKYLPWNFSLFRIYQIEVVK